LPVALPNTAYILRAYVLVLLDIAFGGTSFMLEPLYAGFLRLKSDTKIFVKFFRRLDFAQRKF
jgi:hypothetical protein